MSRLPARRVRVLGLYPNQLGSAYAVIETHARLLAYGQLRLRPRTTNEFRTRLAKLVSRYVLHTLVFEADNAKRSPRVRDLIQDSVSWAVTHHVPVETFALAQLKLALGLQSDDTKRAVMRRLVDAFPELRCRIRSEASATDRRNDVFWAIALAAAGSVRVQLTLAQEDSDSAHSPRA